MNLLDEESFKALLGGSSPKRLTEPVEMPPDFWAYFDRIPPEHFAGFRCTGAGATIAYRTADGRHDLVHIRSDEDEEAFMVLVVGLSGPAVVGHRLMDFKREYGIRSPS